MHLRLSLKNRIPWLCRWLIGATSRVINVRIDRQGFQYSNVQRSAYISFFEWYYCILPFVIVRLFFLPNEPLSITPIHTRMYNAISCEAALFKGCLAKIEKIHQVAYGSTSWVSFWLFKYPWRWFFSPRTKYAPSSNSPLQDHFRHGDLHPVLIHYPDIQTTWIWDVYKKTLCIKLGKRGRKTRMTNLRLWIPLGSHMPKYAFKPFLPLRAPPITHFMHQNPSLLCPFLLYHFHSYFLSQSGHRSVYLSNPPLYSYPFQTGHFPRIWEYF